MISFHIDTIKHDTVVVLINFVITFFSKWKIIVLQITKIARVVHETKEQDFQVLAGSTGFLLPSLLVG